MAVRKKNTLRFSLQFGAMAKPIKEQLEAQGLCAPWAESGWADKMATAVTLLKIHGILTDAEVSRAHKRIAKQLDVRPIPSEDSQ